MQRLKPNETEALLLLASGMSYREIGEAKGWTYTKVNRLLTEGRQAFRLRIEGIESGAECERWRATLTRIADREASPDEITAIEPHLSRCGGCRSLLRSDREATQAMALVLPGLATASDLPDEVPHRLWGTVGRAVSDFLLAVGLKVQGVAEAAASTKVVAVAASTAAIAGGGVAIEQAARPALHAPRPVVAVKGELRTARLSPESQRALPPATANLTDAPVREAGVRQPAESSQKTSPTAARQGTAGEFDPLETSAHGSRSSAQPASAGSPAEAPDPAGVQPSQRTLSDSAPNPRTVPNLVPKPAAAKSIQQSAPEFGP